MNELDVGTRPFPGVLQARNPLAWYDSLAVSVGGGGASDGFEGALAHADLRREPLRPAEDERSTAIGDLILGSGTNAFDENALWIRWGDSLSHVGAGAESWKRDAIGPYGPAGRHVFGASGLWRFSDTRVEGAFGHRGSAGSLLGGEEQSVNGVGGSGGIGYLLGRNDIGLSAGRSTSGHESFGGVLFASRRDAREHWAAFEWRRDSTWFARLDVRDSKVTRVTELTPEQEWTTRSVWLALRADVRPRAGDIRAELGIGREDGQGTEVAPSLSIVRARVPFTARLFVERVLTSVWSDLAPGQERFLQNTWAGGVDLGIESPQRGAARLGWLMGRTRDRAVIGRLPLEEQWLRAGFRRDPNHYDFALATGSAELRGRHWRTGGEAFALLRDRSSLQPNVDPGRGARAFAETRFTLFAGDLGVRLRGEMDVVGGRESEAPVPVYLPRYVTFGAGLALTLVDAVVSFRMLNLEDERHPEVWIDGSTGVEALGPGREYRFTLTWRFFD